VQEKDKVGEKKINQRQTVAGQCLLVAKMAVFCLSLFIWTFSKISGIL